ncbi:MAG TPA: TetR/AcrR family transcriptional regulator [Nocardioides sp.]|uniref:TetR/AcrR family transcriptional regulator n=1 Tax=Nocardioides sp. TaxID=35761 RepID=UPI002E366CB9|nr:TetR/AcrR family transcriptional regulator [Nocardioides sp.]HEX5090331.1 TetR/AcrR family transcriptional regulator [Nocardioides sp.]
MPVTVDHDVRRREVAEAVWRVLADTGFAGLSMRAVARELGATTGLLTHYFGSKRELVQHALEVVHERTAPRMAAAGEGVGGLEGLRLRLRAVLVEDEEAAVLSKVWVGFWDLALADAELGRSEAARYERWRERLRPLVDEAIDAGDLNGELNGELEGGRETIVDILTAFTHGLVVQALFDPDRFPVERQYAALDALLAALS